MKFDKYSIRPLEIEDYYQLVQTNRKRLEDFFAGTISKTSTYKEAKKFVESMVNNSQENSYFPFLIIDSSSQRIIGFVGLYNIDRSIPKSEVGFFIDKEYTGRGIATGALQVLSEYCFSEFKFKKLFLRIHQSNIASKTVAERCGFELEGEIRREYKTSSGEIVDLLYYGKLNQ
ncbi:MAG: GNAT family N-acetyltransferase [Allomuricauda sp.]|jgi:ribosomal-protein-serine acetyltransferase